MKNSLVELLKDPSTDLICLCSPFSRRTPSAASVRLEAASESGKSFREMGPSAFVQPRDIVFGGQIGEVVQIFSQKSYPDHDGRPPDGNIDGGRCCFRSESLPHDGSSLSADNPSHRSKPSKPKSETRDRARSAWSSASKGI